jgi:hypothetical protein
VTVTAAALDAVPPAAGAAVMGTGIVSIGLRLDGWTSLSRVLLAIAAALWVGLVIVLARRAVLQRQRWISEARTPAILTAVAGTAVLGARLAQLVGVGAAELFGALTLVTWVWLVPRVVRHWTTPAAGVSFVLAVATESLAVLAALVAIDRASSWLALAALLPLALGVAAYAFVLAGADPRQLLVGRGDHWIVGGALAITTLACAHITVALRVGGTLAAPEPALLDATLVLWAASALWLPVLLAGEGLAPRLGDESRRWSTVFPFGMYAVCSVAAGGATGDHLLTRFGDLWIWVAFALWAAVFAGTLRRGGHVLAEARSGQRPPPHA